ncbi:hypothetical protein MACH15_19510 [Maricaulis maris]|nr:hypothetical protein MACH15_19510 [Maricaulis maris]
MASTDWTEETALAVIPPDALAGMSSLNPSPEAPDVVLRLPAETELVELGPETFMAGIISS